MRWTAAGPAAIVVVLALGGEPALRAMDASSVHGARMYALLVEQLWCDRFRPCRGAVEIVGLDALRPLRTIAIATLNATSLAVSPDERSLYIVGAREVAIYDVPTRDLRASVSVQGPRDAVLSPDGATLYVTAHRSVVAIDTETYLVRQTLQTGDDQPLGIALSEDGTLLATPTTRGGHTAQLYLVETGGLGLLARTRIAGPPGCFFGESFPRDVVFMQQERALLWDSNCDALYQVDLTTMQQLPDETVTLGRDGGAFFNYNNMLQYSATASRAYALKESRDLAVVDPLTASGSLAGGFSGIPFVPALTPDGSRLFISVIHRFSGGGPDSFDAYDVSTGIFSRDVYRLATANMSVRDLRIVTAREHRRSAVMEDRVGERR